MKVLSDKAQNKVICVFLLIGSIGLVVYGVTHIFSSIEYKLSSDVRHVTAVVKDYQISVKTDEKGDEDVKYHAILSFEVDGKTYTGKDVFSRDISRGDEVTEKAYRALNGEYKLYTGDIGDNITSVMMIPAGIIISIFLISNTVSVGIAVRKEEIGIMKYIGATDAFVRAPFLLEGMVLGVVGAAVPLIVLYFCYNGAISYILTRFNVLTGVVDFIPVWQIYQTLLPISLGLGIGIGLIGSFFTTRKHLRV